MSDPLGRRGVRPSFTEPRGDPLLSDDALAAIAHDVRTLPLSEVGRHVMPLFQHARVIEDRAAELLACVRGLWDWQRNVDELLPDGLGDRVRAVLTACGVDPNAEPPPKE